MTADQPLAARVDALEARVDELFGIVATLTLYQAEVQARLAELNSRDDWLTSLLKRMRTDPDGR